VVYAGPSVTSSAAPPSRPSAAPEPAPALPAAAEPTRSVAAPAVAPAPNPTPPPPRTTVSAAAPAPVPADTAPSTQAASRIDLNTASVEELNAIPGAGLIGRAIVRGRPYASPEDLLTKRVLNRATYDRIKDQIAVQ
jgi:DNA uptake protein ComE-like DNA-binding protein